MKRLAAVCSLALVGGAALVPLLPRVSYASTCPQPQVSGISVGSTAQQFAAPGSAVTINGTNLQPFGCSTSVTIGGTTVSPSQQTTNSAFFFSVPQGGLSGEVVVTLTDSLGSPISDSNHLVFVTTPAGSGALSTSGPMYTGTTAQESGSYLNFNIGNLEGYSATYVAAHGGNCAGVPASPPSLADASHLNVPLTTQFCQGTVTVTLSAPTTTNSGAPRMSFPLKGAPFDIAPHVTAQPGSGTAGQNVTVGGSGFGTGGSVVVGSVAAGVSSWTDGSVSFTVPSTATSGNVQLTRSYDGVSFSGGGLSVTATANAPSPAKAAVGDPVTVSGAGLGSPGSVTVNSVQATVSSWTSTAISFTVPSGATTGPIAISPNGTNPPASSPSMTVIPKITGITPSNASAGSLIEIDGTTFGTSQGTASVGGQSAQVTLWGDSSVVAQIPAGLPPGSTTVTVSPPSTDSASYPYSIAAPTPSSSSSSSSSSAGHSSSSQNQSSSSSATSSFIAPSASGPIIAHGPVNFVRPSPPPGPVSLRLNSTANQADPGSTVKFSVTLIAFGKPVAGAPVDLLLVIEPGSDASILPSHAVTDASGQVQGTIHLSKTPGDHIVLARSGIYSDEIRVVGRSASNTVASSPLSGSAPGNSPPFLAVRSPVLWALVSCLLLFGIGFGLNLMTSPAVSGAPAGGPGQSRGAAGSLRGAGAMLGDVVRVPAGLVAVLGATLVGAMRRGRG